MTSEDRTVEHVCREWTFGLVRVDAWWRRSVLIEHWRVCRVCARWQRQRADGSWVDGH